MKKKMFITSIFALLLVPLANSCDPTACKIGTSVGSGVCQVGAAIGGAAAAGAICAVGAWFTFGLSCAAAAITYAGVGAGCAGAGLAVKNACAYCASDDAPDFQEIANKLNGLELNVQGISNKLDGTEKNFQEIFNKLDGTDHKFKEIFNKLDGTEQNLQEIMNKLDGFELNFQEFVDKTDLHFQKLANKLDGILDGTEQNFQEIFKKLDGTDHKFKEIFNKLDGTEQNLQEIRNKLDGFELNFQEFVDKTDLHFQTLANKLYGIEQTQLENHLKQEAWFQQLVENDKNIILRQGEMIALQQTTVGQLDQLITTTETLGNKIGHTETVSLYGQNFVHVRNVRSKFKLLTRGTSGVIVNDHRAKIFHDAVLSPNFGSETSINNIFLMLRGGHILKKESIYETPGDKYCKPEVHKYFFDVLVESLMMHSIALSMDGHTLSPQLAKNFNENIIKATSAFVQHCNCAPGLKKANRGNVSTLLDQLPSGSQNLLQNRGQVAAIENSVMRFKMDIILDVKNMEPNEFVESILEKHSVEDIELVVASVMNKKEDDLELHDSADICVDKERNKVETCAAFTQDSFVVGCDPPQTLEHGRFFCVEDGVTVTCHVVCDPGYYLEITDMAGHSALKAHRFMKCLGNTWTPLPTTFQCTLDCDNRENAQNPACAVDGGWSGWSAYTPCSLTCGRGTRSRERTCTEPKPANGGSDCFGNNKKIKHCFLRRCPVDGGWSGWSAYTPCSLTCGSGTRSRERTCTEPRPANGGRNCLGNDKKIEDCFLPECPATCRGGATLLSTSPGLDMVLCKDKTQTTCEKDFESLCPAGWNLCTPGQFNNRNDGWDYNWKDDNPGYNWWDANAGGPLGVIYCRRGDGSAGHYYIDNAVLNRDEGLNCVAASSRPGCEFFAGRNDCDFKGYSALCCAPTRTCGDGVVQQEEDCDDGNNSNIDDCLNSCTWKNPGKHGFRGSWC